VNLILPSRNIIAEEDYESPDHNKNNIRSISVSSSDRPSQLLLSMVLVSIGLFYLNSKKENVIQNGSAVSVCMTQMGNTTMM
jgi:hypothetical protein